MTTLRQTILVPYTAAQMFALVNDIEHYPTFLPWCQASKVYSRNEEEVHASIEVAKGGFSDSFSTVNRLQSNKLIEVTLLEGPFRHLEGCWRFDSISDQGCRVTFDVEFEFKNKLINLTVSPLLGKASKLLMEAFYKRAQALYGK
jgi:ribosome-associated toxin RatA of RatAB toxin-antitoxin module